ncbi:tRNA 2-thiocytidine(32) synthetase TtcA [Psychrosphaera haliotis]|uniref:tRNA-cytidine(32) 2-sulfurtransferase n=1 Tax=Psychrosphaera haliotis TaxID=555083 RepID=A0A6N8F5F7_9GAMM|nr:tRNA 2-thiocytidine(32) synthetase TtcA [Psychrosphaera haliotis]MDB2373704.1 tRNA 2-thiocytidine(32) synthetase TtcA [Psychrosphaera haliotis]MUH71785.1 tRNA 2-thiocytidine(32) synthetase TtcA [Psychrosphaera haliotis]
MNNTDPRKAIHEQNKLEKRLRNRVGKAIAEYNMIEESDVVMAAISGGKDSFAMLDILIALQKSAPIDFKIIAVNLDQKQPGFPEHILPAYFESLDIPYYIVDKDTYSIVKEKVPEGKTTCGLCSRLRRGTLYSFAESIGATKIALGHHMDDMVETMFLNMFHGAKLKSMPPKLRSDDKRNVVIRPLAFCREKDLIKYAEHKAYPIIPCNLCGSQENLQRQSIKAMLTEWDNQTPGRIENIFNSMKSVSLSQLADGELFDFKNLPIDRSEERKEYEFSEATVSSSNIDESLIIDVTHV